MLHRLFDILNYSLLKNLTVSWVSSSCASRSSRPQQPHGLQQLHRAHQAACIHGLLWSQQRAFLSPHAYVVSAMLRVQGYDAYAAVLYIMVAVTWACVAGCGWVAFKFSKDGVVPNKW